MSAASAVTDPTAADLATIVQPAAAGRHTATVIFFHGLGDRGDNLVQWLRYILGRDFATTTGLAHIKCIFPTAPRQPFTLFDERPANVWFNVWGKRANITNPERKESYAGIDGAIARLIDAEVRAGVPLARIVVGGFSMGGYIALHAALRVRPGLGGAFVLSSFLAFDTAVFDAVEERRRRTRGSGGGGVVTESKVLWLHGDGDELLLHEWGRVTSARLRSRGVPVDFRTFVGMKHEMRGGELQLVERWLAERLPAEIDAGLVHKL